MHPIRRFMPPPIGGIGGSEERLGGWGQEKATDFGVEATVLAVTDLDVLAHNLREIELIHQQANIPRQDLEQRKRL
jgi:hypothetical protein